MSRILLFDEHECILLLRTASPSLAVPVVRWLTPGGGVEDHESHAEGAIRELFEETGLRLDAIGEPVWSVHGVSEFNDGTTQTTYAEYFVARTERFTPSRENWMDNEHVDISDIRWWSANELRSTSDAFAPLNLLDLVERHRLE